jgi:DNA polymerase (family 10)
VYTHAGLAYLPPHVRHAPDAIDAAMDRRVPQLVQREDIRGDLHMHTTYSDGRDTLRRMIMGAHALGYEYIAITDHSEHSAASRNITPSELVRQREEIETLRGEAPGMTILHGIEVDILPNGTLDADDGVLAKLDIVLASLHDEAGHSRKQLTARCLGAIRHPLVSAITHPGNQLVGRRPAYDMDYDAIYAAAAETGTALEVDGAPSHLDLDGDRARAAVAAGVTLMIDSDCHRAAVLDRQMRFGVGTARRGWVEPRHVLNTRPIGDVLAFLRRKPIR